MENKERFQTQTLTESSILSGSPPLSAESDTSFNLQKEADLVLKTLHATKSSHDDLLDCETLSLVSNDDDSEHNSASSINYRTYHKSWGISQNNIPIISSTPVNKTEDVVNSLCSQESHNIDSDEEESSEITQHIINKPKIVKPIDNHPDKTQNQNSPKGIRGRRKPLYSKSNLNNKIAPKSVRPVRNVTSNLVKNVTSNFKPIGVLKPISSKQTKTVTSKPVINHSKMTTGGSSRSVSQSNSPKTSPARAPTAKGSPKHIPTISASVTGHPKGMDFFKYIHLPRTLMLI